MQQIIYDQQPHIRPNNQAPPINQTTQKAKSSNPNTPTPHKANHTPTDLQNKNHPKGITNSWFKLPKFQTSSTPTQTGPHPKFMSHQVKSTLNLIYSQGARLKTRRN